MSLEVADFKGDFEELSAVMRRSWQENAEQPLLYSESYLRSYLTAPGTSVELMPAAYASGKLVGFIAGLEKSVRNCGEGQAWALSCLLTVESERKKMGIGPMLWRELLERCRANGLAGMISYCVEGDPMNRMVEGLGRILQYPTRRVFTLEFMARPLAGEGREGLKSQAPGRLLASLADGLSSCNAFIHRWGEEDAEWHCTQRAGAITTVGEGSRGMLCGNVAEVADAAAPVKCLFVDDVLWGDLDGGERERMLADFLAQGKQAGAMIAVCPLAGYTDYAPLIAARFRRTRRRLHVYLTSWTEKAVMQSLGSWYLEVV